MSVYAIVGIVVAAIVLVVGGLFLIGACRASSHEYTGEKQ